jgi:hypothetical protein
MGTMMPISMGEPVADPLVVAEPEVELELELEHADAPRASDTAATAIASVLTDLRDLSLLRGMDSPLLDNEHRGGGSVKEHAY